MLVTVARDGRAHGHAGGVMDRKGLTLMELLLVVACSVGVLAACEATGPSPEDAIVMSMRSDLERLVTAQHAFFSANNDYAGYTTSGAQLNGTHGMGRVSFVPSAGNHLNLDYLDYNDSSGWRATITNAALANDQKTCGVYTGDHSDAPDPALTEENVPGCWRNDPMVADSILATM